MIKQKAQAPNIKGEYGSTGAQVYSGAFTVRGYGAHSSGAGATAYSGIFNASNPSASADINGENIYTNNGELRPLNFTVKLWMRIS